MKIVKYPSKDLWPELSRRPQIDASELEPAVADILRVVAKRGDAALIELTQKFDDVNIESIQLSPSEIEAGAAQIEPELKDALHIAHRNIEAFHRCCHEAKPKRTALDTMPGVSCWREALPIESVGLYIPGGSAPLFSTVLMLGVPAQIAGSKTVALCTPPQADGSIHPGILYAARLTGIESIFRVGGAQAIAALAYGSESVPRVDKIFGPGNQYVTCAKSIVARGRVAIDMPAGPSEVAVIADSSACAAFVAADLLSQAEHGRDSQVMLLSTDEQLLDAVQKELSRQLETLPRKELARASLENSTALLFSSSEEALAFSNHYAPEHLIIQTADVDSLATRVTNAGSVFLGDYAPESVGDYASGTNHVLPTGGHARTSAGVSVDTFLKNITFQRLTKEGLQNLGPAVCTMAAAEQLDAHGRAVAIRLEEDEKNV